MIDLYFKNVVVILPLTSSSNFNDLSNQNFTVTQNGVPTITTDTDPFGNTDGVLRLDAGGEFLSIPHHSLMDISTGAFTVDFFCKPLALSVNYPTLFTKRGTGDNLANGISLYIDKNSKKVGAQFGDSDTASWNVNLTSTSIMSTTEYKHIEFSRDENDVFRLFINGTLEASVTDSVVGNLGTTPLLIGGEHVSPVSCNCLISDFRITHSVCRHNANFTPRTSHAPTEEPKALSFNITGCNKFVSSVNQNVFFKKIGI